MLNNTMCFGFLTCITSKFFLDVTTRPCRSIWFGFSLSVLSTACHLDLDLFSLRRLFLGVLPVAVLLPLRAIHHGRPGFLSAPDRRPAPIPRRAAARRCARPSARSDCPPVAPPDLPRHAGSAAGPSASQASTPDPRPCRRRPPANLLWLPPPVWPVGLPRRWIRPAVSRRAASADSRGLPLGSSAQTTAPLFSCRAACSATSTVASDCHHVLHRCHIPPPAGEGEERGSNQATETPIIASDEDVLSLIVEQHELFLSSTRSRLTKLQIIHQMWDRNDIRGVISAMEKMCDHAVSADMASVLMEKSETITLDLCTSILPVFTNLLESKTDRHLGVSLELLVKLVRTFGPVIHSTVSAGPSVGVDLQAEQRRERCNLCFIELEKVKNKLPFLTRRKGAVANAAQELALVFQEVMS